MTGLVVGVDGSPAGTTAARWAAHEAEVRHVPVHLLHSWTTQPPNVPVADQARSKRRYGQEVLLRTASDLRHHHGHLTLTTELVSATAAQALLDRSTDADLLVLGSRGHGSVASFLLGSTALHVLGLTRCPAVVVRADDATVEADWDHLGTAGRNEIVVGVREPGPAADPLLEFAFTTADAHGLLVRAITAVPPRSGPCNGKDQRARLEATLTPWQEKFPEVAVVQHVTAGPAAEVLPSSCTHSRLLIVGRRPHPPRGVWKLGPVTHAALRHVACPVAVVPQFPVGNLAG
ncbi:universal stress protein [Streptomyces spinoverrucosus]|uniref:Universal stress protein n=1 Tax=Streptomyces spinoverrucosus TaxID=284043 RepID=A0A4Y3V633_9ACTN|nr:universal stress protein [Streptomyces spinoverrucosus]GEC02702.1 universal stress protein [Streptomyces spinoverrucosus]GHB41098.1 universal stress protein [Streptomyces spinoverrucosus]